MVTLRHPFAPPVAPERTPEPYAWMDRATCATVDPMVWHADGSGGDTPVLSSKARAMCRWCPVARECWSYVQRADEMCGIYAGLTYRERREAYRAMGA